MDKAKHDALMDQLANAVLEGRKKDARKLAQEAIDAGVSPLDAFDQGLIKGIKAVEDGFVKGTLFLPELVSGGEAMKAGLEVLEEEIKRQGMDRPVVATVLIGTVKTDIHDIGKNIVASVMAANGFDVIDIGVDVPPEKFAEKIRELKPDVLALSALLTTSIQYVKATVDTVKEAGLRDGLLIIAGGAALNDDYTRKAGCDFFGQDAIDGVRKLLDALGGEA
ncbi:MAG TPA: cobalamin-binding protein [Syntrophomonadaceae bacterium]|nr:cobalamin-binding protein [Syntrophomonadaceae bacterium]